MNNELVLSTDINVITAEINSYKQVAGQAIFEIGKRLKHAKENDLVHGEWEKWLSSNLGFTRQHANRFIRVVERFPNGTSMFQLGITSLELLVDFDDEQIDQSHTIPSTGETKTVDEMTVRELREVKKSLKEESEQRKLLEEENESLYQQLQLERNKPQQVNTVEVEKATERMFPSNLVSVYYLIMF